MLKGGGSLSHQWKKSNRPRFMVIHSGFVDIHKHCRGDSGQLSTKLRPQEFVSFRILKGFFMRIAQLAQLPPDAHPPPFDKPVLSTVEGAPHNDMYLPVFRYAFSVTSASG